MNCWIILQINDMIHSCTLSIHTVSNTVTFLPQRMESGRSVTSPPGKTSRRTCMRTSPFTWSLRESHFSTSSTSSSLASSLVFWLYSSSTCLRGQVGYLCILKLNENLFYHHATLAATVNISVSDTKCESIRQHW